MTDLSQAFCYWPNGTTARNTTSGEYALPCDTGRSVSSCCLPGQVCNTQFRCLDVYGKFTAASCTQKDFNNYNCPCPNQVVGRDPTTGCSDGTVCCGVKNSSCCAKGQGRLSILYDNYSAIPTAASDISSYLSGYTPSTTATDTSSSASTSSTAAQTTSAPTSSLPDINSDPYRGPSSGVKAAIGIGIALLVAAIALLVGWFLVRKRNQTQKSKSNGIKTQGQRLDGNDYEGNTWFRNEVEGDTHHPSQNPIEMEQQHGNPRPVVPNSTTDAFPVSPLTSELEAHSPYRYSPGVNQWGQSEQQVKELEQTQTRPTELEQPSWPLNKRATIRHELE